MDESSHNATYKESKYLYSLDEHKHAHLFDNLIWLTTEEAASFLRKTSHALRQLTYKGKIRPRKFCGRLYFKKSELNELIDTSFT